MKLVRTLVAGLAILAISFPVFAEDQSQSPAQPQPSQNQEVLANNDKTTMTEHSKTTTEVTRKSSENVEMVNINKAEWKDLTALKGIGKKKAEAIVSYRKKNGDFKSVEDLKNVKGITAKIIEKNKDRIEV